MTKVYVKVTQETLVRVPVEVDARPGVDIDELIEAAQDEAQALYDASPDLAGFDVVADDIFSEIELDYSSSASRQYYVETGGFLPLFHEEGDDAPTA